MVRVQGERRVVVLACLLTMLLPCPLLASWSRAITCLARALLRAQCAALPSKRVEVGKRRRANPGCGGASRWHAGVCCCTEPRPPIFPLSPVGAFFAVSRVAVFFVSLFSCRTCFLVAVTWRGRVTPTYSFTHSLSCPGPPSPRLTLPFILCLGPFPLDQVPLSSAAWQDGPRTTPPAGRLAFF